MVARMRRRHRCGKGAYNRFLPHVAWLLGRYSKDWHALGTSSWNTISDTAAANPRNFRRGETFSGGSTVEENGSMFGWALTFLVVALIAAVLGFGGIAGFAVEIAQLIFYVAIILLVISVVVGLIRGRTTTVP
jgi:uncharacterized membrane protein YtjA (UPF0391 family)